MEQQLSNLSPLPPLIWDRYFWKGTVLLPSWAGTPKNIHNPSTTELSDGTFNLSVKSPTGEADGVPTEAQASAFQQVLDSEVAVRDAVLQAIFAVYPDWIEAYGYDEEEAAEFMPNLDSPIDLMHLVQPATIHILRPDEGSGQVYVGFELECTWDPEHGIGVKLAGTAVVDVGSATTAFE